MDSSYVMPFIASCQNVFETMVQLPVQVGKPELKKAGQPAYDVSGIIGMSGDVEGAVVLSFPTNTATRVVQAFTGLELAHTDADFADAIGELVNMIAGSAKAQLSGKQVNISCPSVVVGSEHVVFGSKDVVCITVPCTCDCGDFAVEITVRNLAVLQSSQPTGAGASA